MALPSPFQATSAWLDAHPVLARWVLAGPVAFFMAVLAMAALPLILPEGAGGVDHLVLPVVIFPLIWAAAMLYPVMASLLGPTAFVMLGILILEVVMILSVFL
ncbi:MAG: hypothetical protein AAGI09_12510 [Pseudomonadota bacterium]